MTKNIKREHGCRLKLLYKITNLSGISVIRGTSSLIKQTLYVNLVSSHCSYVNHFLICIIYLFVNSLENVEIPWDTLRHPLVSLYLRIEFRTFNIKRIILVTYFNTTGEQRKNTV